jgi:hypothetical protein
VCTATVLAGTSLAATALRGPENRTARDSARALAAPAQTFWREIGEIEGSRPSLAIDDAGRAHVALFGPEAPNGAELRHALESGDGWTVERVDGPEDIGATTAIAIHQTTAHVAYDYPRYGIRYAFPEPEGSWKRIKVEASNPSGTQVSLAMAPGGDPHIGFLSSANADWRQGRWRASREDFNLRTSALGDVGFHGAVAVGSDDAYHFAYYNETLNSVYYERDLPRRANITVYSPVEVVGRMQLALESDDNAQLAFPTSGGPVWARRVKDEDSWDIEGQLPGGETALHVAMTIDADGDTHLVWEGPPGTYHYAVRDQLPGATERAWRASGAAGLPTRPSGGLALASWDDRLLIAVDDRTTGRVRVFEAAPGDPPTPVPPTPTRRPTAVPTVGPSPTPAPAGLNLWLSAGCDREYGPGTILFAWFSSSRSGRIVIDHAPPGPRPLYDGPVVVGRPWAAALGVDGPAGRRTLVATMPEFGLEARCRYDVVE